MSSSHSSADFFGSGVWAKFSWLPQENVRYLCQAMADEGKLEVPGDLPEHRVSFAAPDEDFLEDPDLEVLLREYLEEVLPDGDCSTAWTLRPSPLDGRGVFATRDLEPGDLVMVDQALVIGPRAGAVCPPVCAGCHSARRTLFGCSRGCGLPVCSEGCELSAAHRPECCVLVAWRPLRAAEPKRRWSPGLLRALCPIRALALAPRRRALLASLLAHTDPQHAFELDLILRNVDEAPHPRDAALMRLACRAFDSNAFETVAAEDEAAAARDRGRPTDRGLDGAGATLRGLFPLAAMLNHACTPNTRHGYDAAGRLRVHAAHRVSAGQELTNSYTPLLWATPARRHLLAFTKHFHCACARCADPKELGAQLSALLCAREGCAGVLLPVEPLRAACAWTCGACGLRMSCRQAASVQQALGGPLAALDASHPDEVLRVLRRLRLLLPPSNHVLLELKSCLVWLLGHRDAFRWPDLSEELLDYKEELCRELLKILLLLKAGQCRLRGLVLYELHCTLVERLRRDTTNGSNKTKAEANAAIEESAAIFDNDITAPCDLWKRLHRARECNDVL